MLILIAVVIIVFFVQNMELITIKFLKQEFKIYTFAALLLFYILGAISGGMLLSLIKSATSSTRKEKEAENTEQNKDVQP